MKNKLSLSLFYLSIISVPFFLMASTNSFAKSSYSRGYNDGYDDGYEDGYDDCYEDAMEECPCPPWRHIMQGVYVGFGAGYEGYQIQRSTTLFDERIGKFNTHANGWNGRLFGGYGRYFNNFYLGGELFTGLSNAHGTDSISTAFLKYKGEFSVGQSWGVSILPGYKFGNSGPLLYGRLGYIQTELKTSDWGNNFMPVSKSASNWTNGFNIGVGVEVPIYQNLSGRLEYSYVKYSAFEQNGSGPQGGFQFPTGGIGSNNTPSDNRGSLDLIYHLGKF